MGMKMFMIIKIIKYVEKN